MSHQMQVASAIAAYGVLIFFGGVVAWRTRARDVRRLRRYVSSHLHALQPGSPRTLKRPSDASALATGLNRKIGQSNVGRQLQLQLVRSGLGITANQFILGQVTIGSLLFLVWRYILFADGSAMALIYSLGMAVPAVVIPRFVLKQLEHRRVRKFESQLAQAVDIMVGALQAGTSLPQSFELVAREMPSPIGVEFGRLLQEAALAVPLDQALNNMLERVPSADLEMLVSAINIQYRVGGNLSHILKTIAHTIRERVRIRGEINTLTAQARLSSYIISGMPFAVVGALMIISPSYIMKLFDPGITRVMLIGGLMGIVSGYYVMKRIAAIEV